VQSEDVKTQSACAGALATLSRDAEIAKKFEGVIDLRAFIDLIASDNVDLEHRGVVIVKNLLKHAQKVSDILLSDGDRSTTLPSNAMLYRVYAILSWSLAVFLT